MRIIDWSSDVCSSDLQLFRFRDGHALRVQPDRRNIAAIAQQRVRQLADMRFDVALAQPRFPHHLLGIMRPALGKGIADEQLAEDALRAVRMEKVEEMPRPNLVERGEEQVLLARKDRKSTRLNSSH